MPSNAQGSHAPLASLAAHWNACKGDIPPPLVGASVTLVDDQDPTKAKIYLFGGRLVTTRRMVNDMYELDLLTLRWTKLFADENDVAHSDEDDEVVAGPSSQASTGKPQARYFHSCNFWQGKLIIFGGMGYVEGDESELGVLNEVVAFDLSTYTWDFQFELASSKNDAKLIPQPRYAHLSSVTADSLVIVGGQDMANRYVEEINVFDLQQRQWTHRETYDKQRGSYRSLAIEPQWEVEEPSDTSTLLATTVDSAYSTADSASSNESRRDPLLSAKNISMLPTSSLSYNEDGKVKPLPVYIYTNYNFTDVKREMEIVRLENGSGVQIEDQSNAMSGLSLPPGLRFPMGAILGVHLLISGTYLANTSQTFAVWALHLPTMTWSRLDVGPLLSSGSWNRGILWPTQNRLIIFGHRDRDLVADYNHRQTNWDHVLMIELEAWGITQPPIKSVSLAGVRLGLNKLASSTIGSFSSSLESGLGLTDEQTGDPLLSFGGRGDFEIICSDGVRLGCDRVILEKRWPWFAAKMAEYQHKAKVLSKNGSLAKKGSRPGTGEQLTALMEEDERGVASLTPTLRMQVDPRITPRQLHIGEPSPVMLALLIFLYTRCICTQLQRHPAIVAALLIVSKVYDMKDLQIWAKHAAHVIMSETLAPPSSGSTSRTTSKVDSVVGNNLPVLERHRLAVALYEAATMSGYEALQIRALRTVMSIAKWVQRSSGSSSKSSAANDSLEERQNTMTTTTTSSGSMLEAQQTSGSQSTSSMLMQRGETSKSTGGAEDPVRRMARSDRAMTLDNAGASPFAAQQSLSRSSMQSGQSGVTVPSQRRPSVPTLSTTSNGNATTTTTPTNSAPRPPPSVTNNTSTARKRFSIFGRGSDQNKSNSNVNSTAHAASTLESAQQQQQQQEARYGRPSLDQQAGATPFSRLQRTNTDGSTGADSSNKSTTSLLFASQGVVGPTTPIEASSTTSLPRSNVVENGKEGSGVSAVSANPSRKMSATLSRLKPSRSAATNEEAIAGATVITAPAKLSASGSESGLPSPALSGSGFLSGGGGGGKGKQQGKIGGGQLNQKDIKALQGIFA